MLFTISLLSLTLLFDDPNPRIGRLDPVRPNFDYRVSPAGPPLSAWNRIQPDLDRSSGRIVDQSTYELDRGNLLRSWMHSPYDAQIERRVFDSDRERWLRIDQRQLDQEKLTRRADAARREAQMQLKEYELYINAGSDPTSSVAAQADADRQRLEQLRIERDAKVKAAGNDRQAIDRVNAMYQKERARILGFETTSPATQPSGKD